MTGQRAQQKAQVNPKNFLIKALDKKPLDDDEKSLNMFKQEVQGYERMVGMIKIGYRAYIRHGPAIVKLIQKFNYDIFLDLKCHDIPETVKSAVYEATCLGVQIINVHAMGGSEMMKFAVEGREEALKDHPELSRPLLIAVTVLTSWTQERINEELLIPGTINEIAEHFAKLTHSCGFDGIVCSPEELQYIQNRCELPKSFVYITPGIRPVWYTKKDDQNRTATPEAAILNGSKGLVIGRPMSSLQNASKTYDEVEKALISIASNRH